MSCSSLWPLRRPSPSHSLSLPTTQCTDPSPISPSPPSHPSSSFKSLTLISLSLLSPIHDYSTFLSTIHQLPSPLPSLNLEILPHPHIPLRLSPHSDTLTFTSHLPPSYPTFKQGYPPEVASSHLTPGPPLFSYRDRHPPTPNPTQPLHSQRATCHAGSHEPPTSTSTQR